MERKSRRKERERERRRMRTPKERLNPILVMEQTYLIINGHRHYRI